MRRSGLVIAVVLLLMSIATGASACEKCVRVVEGTWCKDPSTYLGSGPILANCEPVYQCYYDAGEPYCYWTCNGSQCLYV